MSTRVFRGLSLYAPFDADRSCKKMEIYLTVILTVDAIMEHLGLCLMEDLLSSRQRVVLTNRRNDNGLRNTKEGRTGLKVT